MVVVVAMVLLVIASLMVSVVVVVVMTIVVVVEVVVVVMWLEGIGSNGVSKTNILSPVISSITECDWVLLHFMSPLFTV